MPRHVAFSRILIAAALATFACDHPVDVGGSGAIPKDAGSFDLANACGSVVESASGGIYTLTRSQVDSRSPDGTIVWSKVLAPIGCTAAVAASGNLLVATRDTVFSLNAGTGAITWRFAVGGRADAVQMATSSTGKVFLISRIDYPPAPPETLYALSDADGSLLWSRTLDRAGSPYVDDARSTVYYVTNDRAAAMDLGSGTVKWDTSSDGGVYPAISSDGSLLVQKAYPDYSLEDYMRSEIDAIAADGTHTWRSAMLGPRQYVAGGPVIDDAGTVYSATTANQARGQSGASVYALSVGTGDIKWKHDFYLIKSNIAVDADRTAYVIAQAAADSSDQIYGLRDGVMVSASTPVPRSLYANTPLTIHSNKLLYYVGTDKVGYIPTAGVSAGASWPMDKHDAKRSARR